MRSAMGTLFSPTDHDFERFPATRYQGSKRRSAVWIVEQLSDLNYRTVLDAFGGTGSVAYAFKCAGKAVTYNDALKFNHQIGTALIENGRVRLSASSIEGLFVRQPGVRYGDFVQRTFPGIYFTDEENAQLDVAVGNIAALDSVYERALAWFGLLQAATAKRPYNLFHRANLYMRLADVKRGFGNKASWDRPFNEHVEAFCRQANRAVFDNGEPCRSVCADAREVGGRYDLVYLDPPYVSRTGTGVDYRAFYHFLEGLVQYEHWSGMIDLTSKHRELRSEPSGWTDRRRIGACLREVLERYRESILVVSYRDDGIPTIAELEADLHQFKRRVRVAREGPSAYALSKQGTSREVLLIGTD